MQNAENNSKDCIKTSENDKKAYSHVTFCINYGSYFQCSLQMPKEYYLLIFYHTSNYFLSCSLIIYNTFSYINVTLILVLCKSSTVVTMLSLDIKVKISKSGLTNGIVRYYLISNEVDIQLKKITKQPSHMILIIDLK